MEGKWGVTTTWPGVVKPEIIKQRNGESNKICELCVGWYGGLLPSVVVSSNVS